jgi:tRNA-dihydrouridine synthase 3
MKEVEHPDGRKELVLVEREGVESKAEEGEKDKSVEGGKAEEGEKEQSAEDGKAEEGEKEQSAEGGKAEEGEMEQSAEGGKNSTGDKTAAEGITAATEQPQNGAHEANGTGTTTTAQPAVDATTTPIPAALPADTPDRLDNPDMFNVVSNADKIALSRRRVDYTRTDEYIKWMNKEAELHDTFHTRRRQQHTDGINDLRARYVDPPFLPSEKRRLYFGPETPALAPLTTQGNVPFRRLCVGLGAELTYSEMAMSMHLLQGNKTDWTLLRAHRSELEAPRVAPGAAVPAGYDGARDLRFGAQISASTPWSAVKATDTLTRFCPHLRLVDLNCGCPIDTIFKSGGGSALLETPNKMERIVRGMNTVSGEVPVTAKIRTGVRTSRPNAPMVLDKLAFGSREHREGLGAPGCAAVTLHGRSREMRYTKHADWGYIAECAALVKSYNERSAALCDTAAEPDPRTLPPGGRMFFVGNGDCYSHVDYTRDVAEARVDAVMIGRGALIKPWIFEEIEAGQYLDKTPTQRLGYVETFVRHGLETWGSDEVGVTFTRRFLLEWLSFAHRYVPVGLLEVLPPSLNDRPPPYKGRDEMETLLASPNYKDWIKIR